MIPVFNYCRKSRAKQGRPLGSGKRDASTSTPKKQKMARQSGEVTSSPGPVKGPLIRGDSNVIQISVPGG